MLLMGFFSPFSYFEHMCLKNIIFNKIRGSPVILCKIKPLNGLLWTKSPVNRFLEKEIYFLTKCIFCFHFDYLYQKRKKLWKITNYYFNAHGSKRFRFRFLYHSTKLFVNWKLLSFCCIPCCNLYREEL